MTKRFELIECNGNIEDGCTQNVYDGGEDVFELLDLLNSLNDKNEQLKLICQDHRDHAIDFKADCVRLEKENEQLKKENKELKAKVDDKEVAVEVETCKVMEKIFDLIDKKIKELEDKYEFGKTEYGACPMHNIMFGINVLKELKKELAE